ncbi:Methyltransferase domain-containing protein [Saccharopolyspora shandongensis]|uniref:Methyltransferase domain-containing protein n=1 Tax=Saccharopolyspora shandongensis TaxID=418495 RepID=A0A1H3JRS6_9PSEU|nr:class I SAM-dependent methyltransferase [Saccharopolyspora shandongensis]SDY42637.1 Methyltransferase domain-containing protein [Saccharopolyspora shandongensis]
MTGRSPKLQRAYDLKSKEEAEAVYDEWAAEYDADMVQGMDYVAPANAANRLVHLAGDPGPVLDAGCGTGLVGAELAQRSVAVIDGIDLSQGMLEKARARGIYRDLAKADLTRRLDIPDDTYGAAICVGTITDGHVGPEVLNELVRVVRPGGLVVATVAHVWESRKVGEHINGLATDGRIRLREADEWESVRGEDVRCRIPVLEVR